MRGAGTISRAGRCNRGVRQAWREVKRSPRQHPPREIGWEYAPSATALFFCAAVLGTGGKEKLAVACLHRNTADVTRRTRRAKFKLDRTDGAVRLEFELGRDPFGGGQELNGKRL